MINKRDFTLRGSYFYGKYIQVTTHLVLYIGGITIRQKGNKVIIKFFFLFDELLF